MMRRLVMITTALLAVLAAAASASQTATPKALAMLQGTWVITSNNGQDMTNAGEVLVTITGSQYFQTANGAVVERGSFKIDETKKPMTVDVTITEGDNAGQVQLGLLEVTGDSLRVKFSAPGATARPTNFEPAEGAVLLTARKK